MNRLPYIVKPFALKALFLGGLTAMVVLSGCGATEQKISSKDAKLLSEPVVNKALANDDFSFPSRPPRLSRGKIVFEQNCAVCHHSGSLTYNQIKNVRPIDTYLMITRGDQGHPSFRNLTYDQRWEAIFYARYLAGGAFVKDPKVDIAAVFGSNCAVCHGAKGFADGPLYTGHAAAHELGLAPVKNAFYPPPANFHSYARMYNRTDDLLVKHIEEGVYPSAMPSWKGRSDVEKGVAFDDATIRQLVKYVRSFAYEDDLPEPDAKPAAATGKKSKMLSQVPSGTPLRSEK